MCVCTHNVRVCVRVCICMRACVHHMCVYACMHLCLKGWDLHQECDTWLFSSSYLCGLVGTDIRGGQLGASTSVRPQKTRVLILVLLQAV